MQSLNQGKVLLPSKLKGNLSLRKSFTFWTQSMLLVVAIVQRISGMGRVLNLNPCGENLDYKAIAVRNHIFQLQLNLNTEKHQRGKFHLKLLRC